MKMLKINQQEADSLFKNLSQEYKLLAPKEMLGAGRFSQTNLLTYAEVKSFQEIEFFKKTHTSAKEILLPLRQSLFEFHKGRVSEVKEEILPRIIFLRSCDIQAIRVMDSHFLDNDKYKDAYYRRRREAVKFFLIECKQPFENCFCVSAGTNKTEDYSGFMRKTDAGYEIKIKDKELLAYLPSGKEASVEPIFVEKDIKPISLPEEINVSVFENEIWKEYSRRCSACGRCNLNCPTCTCFTLEDILDEDSKDAGARKRIWSSCQVKNFALLAGNHDFRVPKGDRMRYKILHKIRDFRRINRFNMCVGCGRCDDVCPEYISLFKCIEKINRIALNESSNG